MSQESRKIVQKLWHYCNVLRDDGLSYPDYCEQLTYLLFLKMAHEQATEGGGGGKRSIIPSGLDWSGLLTKRGPALSQHYTRVLEGLGESAGMLRTIFGGARNKIQDPAKLRLLIVDLVDKEQWTGRDFDVKGEAYEGLLEKNAQDTKSGAGQYFTPRALIQAIVEVVDPQIGETICDPACGTCGFLLVAHEYVLRQNLEMTSRQRKHLAERAIRGVELVGAVTRLGAMNLLLHGIGPADARGEVPISTGDSLRQKPKNRFDLVLTNPPFGKKSSVTFAADVEDEDRQTLQVVRPDFWASTANKQLNFLQHVFSLLKPGGRAALVIPDNVLFEGGAGEVIRRALLKHADVHTLLRLPTGIFYAQGVKANVLFFNRNVNGSQSDQRLWIYDLRSGKRMTLRNRPLMRSDLNEFVDSYRADDRSKRKATWSDNCPSGRWRRFDYCQLQAREKCSWDLSWLRDDISSQEPADPSAIAARMIGSLQAALRNLQEAAKDLK